MRFMFHLACDLLHGKSGMTGVALPCSFRRAFDELVKGRVEAASREHFIAIMRRMHSAGAQAVILGCTEFGMLLRAEDAPDIPRVDTTELHCQSAVDWMLAEESGHKDAA
ncbi:MAG: aspartate/glutamate racemase family protein [Rhodanobacteraceae bacterium]